MPEVRAGKRSRRPFGQPCRWLACLCISFSFSFDALPAAAAVKSPEQVTARAGATEHGGSSLESAAAKAGSTGRTVAMSLIGLALAVAATVLAFRRDFKEAAGVFAVGIVAVLLATPSGVTLLRDTVASLFGGP
jgi:hypothetical protein